MTRSTNPVIVIIIIINFIDGGWLLSEIWLVVMK